ncbi:MAG: hypothetical protein WDZ60_04960 [Wenzhouxiangellaceae bacterium]
MFGQSALGLSVNGQLVVPVGQLESFDYNVANGRIDATSFYGDIRCAQLDQSQSGASGLVFNLDRLTSKEDEASYQVFGDGSIEYDTAAGMINVLTSESVSAPDCTHFIEAVGAISTVDGEPTLGTFWLGSFESPIRLESETLTPAVIADKLTIRFTMTNTSAVLVATDIQAPFVSELSPATTEITGPDYSPSSAVTADVWEIPILWPGESAAVEVSYTLNSGAPEGVDIETTVNSVTALNRTDAGPLDTSTPQVTVMATSTAAAP